jgi:hypothetical protein
MGLDKFYDPIDFSRIIGYPHELPEIAIENLPDFHNYGDAKLTSKPLGSVLVNGVIHMFMRMF